MSKSKQVIILRKDLKMTKGKMVAQGTHVSLGAILKMMNTDNIKQDVVSNDQAKQIIAIRKDLKMTKGKMVAQGSHSTIGAIIKIFNDDKTLFEQPPTIIDGKYTLQKEIDKNSDLDVWFHNGFLKTFIYVNNESELLELENAAKELNITNSLITDMGLTMFHGIPTKTTLALGPFDSKVLDNLVSKYDKLNITEKNNDFSFSNGLVDLCINNENATSYTLNLIVEENSNLDNWLRGIFAKIGVYVNSEKELLDLKDKAEKLNIPWCILKDDTSKEFSGLAIGPHDSNEIDLITKELKLL